MNWLEILEKRANEETSMRDSLYNILSIHMGVITLLGGGLIYFIDGLSSIENYSSSWWLVLSCTCIAAVLLVAAILFLYFSFKGIYYGHLNPEIMKEAHEVCVREEGEYETYRHRYEKYCIKKKILPEPREDRNAQKRYEKWLERMMFIAASNNYQSNKKRINRLKWSGNCWGIAMLILLLNLVFFVIGRNVHGVEKTPVVSIKELQTKGGEH